MRAVVEERGQVHLQPFESSRAGRIKTAKGVRDILGGKNSVKDVGAR